MIRKSGSRFSEKRPSPIDTKQAAAASLPRLRQPACDIGGKNGRDFPFHGALAESNAHTMRAPAAARDRLALAE